VVQGRNINIAMASSLTYIMIRKLLFAAVILVAGLKSDAQVIINEEPSITKLMEIYKSKNAQNPIIRAWRIQIMATSDRMEMEQAYKKFERLYPQIDYTWEHNPPYYQVRVGAYERKADLEATLLEMKQDFPLSIPVQDDIAKKDLVEF
jgi:hypothetical protein